jgi:hypothetical protein
MTLRPVGMLRSRTPLFESESTLMIAALLPSSTLSLTTKIEFVYFYEYIAFMASASCIYYNPEAKQVLVANAICGVTTRHRVISVVSSSCGDGVRLQPGEPDWALSGHLMSSDISCRHSHLLLFVVFTAICLLIRHMLTCP